MSTRIYHSLKKIAPIVAVLLVLISFSVGITYAQEEPNVLETGAQVVYKLITGTGIGVGASLTIDALVLVITQFLNIVILNIAALFLTLSGFLFEFVIYMTIVQMKTFAGSDAIVQIWTIIRDILNIAVIFILVYLAIRIIIGQGENVKKIIAGVIVFGVLTNFSLFFTKMAIDLSNIVALEFYQNLREKDLNDVILNSNNAWTTSWLSGSITSTILDQTSLYNFFSSKLSDPEANINFTSDKKYSLRDSWVYVIGIIIAIFALALVFIQATFLFLFRFLALLLILVFSPLMFAGSLFTPLKGKIDQWWGGFTSQLIFAPLFFILLYIGIFMMGAITKITGEFNADNADDFFAVVIVNFLVTIIVIIGFGKILEISKGFSTDFGNSAAGWASKKASGLLSGAAGLGFGAAASTLRSGAKMARLNKLSQNMETSNNPLIRRLGSLTGISNLQNRTFDIRNSALAQKAAGGVMGALNSASGGLTSNLKVGEGSKTTLDQQKNLKETNEAIVEWWEDYEGTKKARELRKQREEAPKKEAEAKQKKLEDREADRMDAIMEKEIDALNIKKYTDLDTEIQYYDETGVLTLPITRNMATYPNTPKGDEDWAKEVKKANVANARHEFKVRKTTLETNADITITQAKAKADGVVGIARYNARANKIKSLNNTPEAKLEKWKNVLIHDPSKIEETEINGVKLQDIIGITNINDILTASDDKIKSHWEVIKSYCEQEKKTLLPSGTNLRSLSVDNQKAYRNLVALETKAKGVAANIDSLKKQIEEKSDKK